MTTDVDNPIRAITFADGMKPRLHLPRRVGRPKAKWANAELERMWNRIRKEKGLDEEYDPSSETQESAILQRAQHWKQWKK